MESIADIESISAFLMKHEPVEEPTLVAVGEVIGDWKITAYIGRGGSGEVYRVEHVYLGNPAAMKILSRDDESSRQRFLREAKVLSSSTMSVFPRLFAYGEISSTPSGRVRSPSGPDSRPYLVIELLEHLPLPKKDAEVAKYLLRICEGVACLHDQGLVHRDIKPQNILQRGDTGLPVLIDLGLLKDTTLPKAHEGISLSIVGGRAVGVGTPKYAAPEQFAGGDISPASDVHALGMLANECFDGKPPRAWARIIGKSTSSLPSQRYATIRDFASAIRHRHDRWIWMPIAAMLMIAVVTGVGWQYQHVREMLKERESVDPPRLTIDSVDVVEAVTEERPSISSNAVATTIVETKNPCAVSNESRQVETICARNMSIADTGGNVDRVSRLHDGRLQVGVKFITDNEQLDRVLGDGVKKTRKISDRDCNMRYEKREKCERK